MASTELRKKPLSIFSFDLHAEVILFREAADCFFIAGPSPAMKKIRPLRPLRLCGEIGFSLLQNQVGEKDLNADHPGEDQKEEDRSQGQFLLNPGQ